jgi:RHS repeat-associated protein
LFGAANPLSSTPKRFDIKVRVSLSPIWIASASAVGPGPAWVPKNPGETSKQTLEYHASLAWLPTRSSVLGFGSSGAESSTTYSYDDNRFLFPTSVETAVRNADSSLSIVRTDAQYDGFGRVKRYNKYTVGDPTAGVSYSAFTYDAIGRLLTAQRPAQSQAGGYTRSTYSRAYDDQNFIVTISDELNRRTRETYDGLGRFTLAQREETSGVWRQAAHVQYDSLGRAAREYDAFGTAHETKYEYDAFGRRIRTYYPKEPGEGDYDRVLAESWSVSAGFSSASLGLPAPPQESEAPSYVSAVRWEKDSAARKASETAQRLTYRGYDIAGRLIWSASQTGPGPRDWSVSCHKYDALDRTEASWVWRTADTGGWDKTSYEYGLHVDSPTAMALPGNGSPEPKHEYGYNSRGLKTAEDPGKPYAISFAYDELDRIKGANYSDPAAPMSSKFFYDHNSRVTRAELYRTGTLLNRTTAAYNLRGWLTSQAWTVDGASYTLGYAYNDAGDRIGMTYPNGTAVSFEYDSQGRLVRIPGYFGSEGQPTQNGFVYDANGFLISATAATGVASAYTADAQGRLKSIVVARQQPAKNILRLDYSYTPQGNVSCISGANGGSPFELRYGYDWVSRLTLAQVPKPSGISTVEYQYDGAGNRTSETWLGSGPVQYQYSAGNYLSTRGAASYTWGPYGQLISKTENAVTTEYGYSAQRLMNAVKVGGAAAANYEYDALGRRVKAVEGGTTIVTLHSGNDIVYEARTEPGQSATATCYLALNGKCLAKIVRENANPAQTFFLYADMVGSIRAITDSAGGVAARFEYEPFGLLTMSTGPMAAGAHRFTGKPEDGATEFYYFGARYYDPEVGRFISRDPICYGSNWYLCRSLNPAVAGTVVSQGIGFD